MMQYFSRLFLVLFVVLVSGCATNSKYCAIQQVANAEDGAKVTIYNAHILSEKISIDRCRQDNVDGRGSSTFILHAGMHRVAHESFDLDDDRVIEQNFEAGKEYHILITSRLEEMYFIGPQLVAVHSKIFKVTSKSEIFEAIPTLAPDYIPPQERSDYKDWDTIR
ncbi:hypothetical protein [Algicola sagamiensis]|uniref:hypothetical protein n=1 Tax=Algicola sagamiensis TaxID=163869 RepID=UPI0012FAA67A|nr:hypothetical protein [Algicola sagamiensis]